LQYGPGGAHTGGHGGGFRLIGVSLEAEALTRLKCPAAIAAALAKSAVPVCFKNLRLSTVRASDSLTRRTLRSKVTFLLLSAAL
jgi:hypothetical protein